MNAKEIIDRKAAAATERKRLEPMFDDAIRLTMPGRKRFYNRNITDSADDIFDETGANAREEFVSRMQAGLFPLFQQFVQLEASSLVAPNDRAAVNRDLEEIAEYAFEEIWASNFAQESAESLNDLAISTGTLLVEDHGTELFNRAISITDILLERGPHDSPSGHFRTASRLKADQLGARYAPHYDDREAPELRRMIAAGDDRELTAIEYTRRDFSDPHEERYEHVVVIEDTKEFIVRRKMSGSGSNPFISFRMSTAAGEVWGRGPLMNAMGAIRTTNLMVELVLENAAMSVVGMYQTDNDGIVNADNVSFVPGAIISKEFGSRGLEPIQQAGSNFNMRDVVLQDQRVNIKRALFNDMLSDPNKTPATATEVAERMADLAHRTSAGFGRVFYEMIEPYMRRVLYLLEKRGDIQLPVKDGRAFRVRAISPLAQAQNGRDIQRLMQDFQIRASIFGPQVASLSYKREELEGWLQDHNGLDERIFHTPAEIAKKADQMSQKMMEMQQQQAQQQAQQQQPMPGGGQ